MDRPRIPQNQVARPNTNLDSLTPFLGEPLLLLIIEHVKVLEAPASHVRHLMCLEKFWNDRVRPA